MQKDPRNPGEYNCKVAVNRLAKSDANSGQQVKTFAVAFNRWAKITPNNGGEKFQQHQIQGNVTHLVQMNSDANTRTITNRDTLTYGTKTLNILAAYDDESDSREVVLHCEEVN